MDTTTLVLIWDDVFSRLLEKIKELWIGNQQELFPSLLENVVLLPLKELTIQSLNFLFEQLQNPYINLFWHDFVEGIVFYLYIGLLFYFSSQIIVELFKKMYAFFIGHHEIKVFDLEPIKKLFFLQCIHFIGFPIMQIILEIYPQFANEIAKIMGLDLSNIKGMALTLVNINSDYLLLEVIALVALVMLTLWLLFQFVRQGMLFIFTFITCYVGLIYTSDIAKIFLPLKERLLQLFLVFICQKLLLQITLTNIQDTQSLTNLLQMVAMLGVIVYLPSFFKQLTKNNEGR